MDELQSAWEAVQNGDLDRAQRIAAALAKADPGNADAWYLLSSAVSGERREVFKRKALDLDPTVVARYLEGEPAEQVDSLADVMESELESTELPTEFFAFPDNRPEVDLEEPADSELEPAEKSKPAPRARARSGGAGLINIFLFLVGLVILVVLYFFIISLF